MTKICPVCKLQKTLEEYCTDRDRCKKCRAIQVAEYRKRKEAERIADAAVEEAQDAIEIAIVQDKELHKLRQDHADLQRKYKVALTLNNRLENSLGNALSIKEFSSFKIEPKESNGDTEAIPIVVLSDWHVGARVDAKTINNLNEFNPEIAEERATKVFQNILKVVKMLRSRNSITRIVVAIIGDIIDNWIHDDQKETNYLTPIQEVQFAGKLLKSGIQFLLDFGDFEEIILPCVFGNHGRMTDKLRTGNAATTSLEWMLYHQLASSFTDSRLKWSISDGDFLYMDVFDYKLRFMHGYSVKYQSGILGIGVPIMKSIYRMNQSIKADCTFMGHFHTLQFHQSYAVNGSLIGPTVYGLRLGFEPEKPQQLLRLLDKKRGFVISSSIQCD